MKSLRVFSLLLTMLLLVSLWAMPAFATGGRVDSEEVTTTTTAPATVKISNFYMLGSNGKYYLCSPTLADNVDKYTFTIPNWMEETTIVVKGVAGLKLESSSTTFTEPSAGVYEGPLKEIVKAEQNYSFTLTDSSTGLKRTIYITVYRSKLACKIESVTMYKGDNVVTPTGSIDEGLTYTLDSGTTSGISFTIMPRHENTVQITKLTGLADNEAPTSDRTTKLELNKSRRYSFKPELVEGTNVYLLEVEAGEVKKSCTINIIVGDANANAPTTTTVTPTTSFTDLPTTLQTLPTTSYDDNAGGFTMSPLLWVFVGVIIAVVLGACIFLIANAVSKNRDDDYDDYDDDYYNRPRRPVSRGRNLADYVDDDYDDGYGSGRSYHRGGDYDSYDDGYSSRRPSGRGSYGGNYDDYDDGFGGYRGGY